VSSTPDDLFGELDSLLDAAGETVRGLADPAMLPRVRPQRIRTPPGKPLYMDLETIPDYERVHQFGLPELPPPIPPTPLEACANQIELVARPSDYVITYMGQINPPDEWLTGLEFAERAAKSRKGILTKIAATRAARELGGSAGQAAEERRKLLSVTPEYCKIAAMGWCEAKGDPDWMVLGEEYREDAGREVLEIEIIERFWELATKHDPLVVFNGISFDLPVLFVRSALLGIEPTRRFDLRTWGNDVIDIFKVRWPNWSGAAMKLKQLAATLGIEVPAGEDMDGAAVEGLMQSREFEKVGKYVGSDVVVLREVHQFYSGFFCP
jgi:hypothetical protein